MKQGVLVIVAAIAALSVGGCLAGQGAASGRSASRH
jgi:hypothetical protein